MEILDSVRHIVQTVAAENDVLFLDLFEKFVIDILFQYSSMLCSQKELLFIYSSTLRS